MSQPDVLSDFRSPLRRAARGSSRTALLSGVAFASVLGCTQALPPAAPPPLSAEPLAVVPARAPAPSGLAALTPDERQLSLLLKTEVEGLVALGARSFQDGWNLAEATDHLAGRLEGLGYALKRRGFEWNGELAQNLEVELPGGVRGDEIVVVAAKFVSAPGSPGADDSASGTAALLALARQMRNMKRERRIRFVLLSTAGPLEQSQAQGAFRYPQQVIDDKEDGGRVVAAVELHGLGLYSDAERTQHSPEALQAIGLGAPVKADFIALVSTPQSSDVATLAADAFATASSLPAKSWVLPAADPFWQTDHGEFARAGIPTVLVTDTLALRSHTPGGPGDISATLDYERMGRAVLGVQELVTRLAGSGAAHLVIEEPTPAPSTPGGAAQETPAPAAPVQETPAPVQETPAPVQETQAPAQ